MISEVPVTQEEIQEAEEANPPPPPSEDAGAEPPAPSVQSDVPKKRGRPKKEPVPEPVPKKKPKAKPKAEPKVKSAALTNIVEEARFSVNDLSNAQLISELVNRQRATQREMKTNLYRSFVM